jgi:hypothetical protein
LIESFSTIRGTHSAAASPLREADAVQREALLSAWLQASEETAAKALSVNRGVLERIVVLLLEKESLDRDDLSGFLKEPEPAAEKRPKRKAAGRKDPRRKDRPA